MRTGLLVEMAGPQNPATTKASKAAVALMLSFSAGYVDIVGYIGIYKLFTANMTGNTVHLARHIAAASWGEAGLVGAVLVAFVGGSLVGRTIIEVGARRRFQRIASVTLVVEAALIVTVFASARASGHAPAGRLLVLLAIAMGVQTATLTRIGPLSIHTTFVTGMINKFAQMVSETLFFTYDRLAGRTGCRQKQRTAFRGAMFFLSIWLLYCAGALVGGKIDSGIGLNALLIPVGFILAAVVVDQVRPLSLEEEHDQV
jgi:uncharacterized membrane protein YoaK (UPF0700 family)